MNFDLNDPINLIHLAKKGQGIGATYQSNDIVDYLNYIREIASINERSQYEEFDQFNKNYEFFSNFIKNIRRIQKNITLDESEIVDLLEKIEDDPRNSDSLTQQQFDFVFGSRDDSYFKELLQSTNLPRLMRINQSDDKFVKEIRDFAKKDKLFNHSIVNVYQINAKQKNLNKKFKHKIRAIHGTSNMSLINILDKGFLIKSQLDKLNIEHRYQGNSLGEGTYFALTSQPSKALSYTNNSVLKYIIVADLYYNEELQTNEYRQFKLTGSNMIHAINVGAYERDELVVLPEQIQPLYILELSE